MSPRRRPAGHDLPSPSDNTEGSDPGQWTEDMPEALDSNGTTEKDIEPFAGNFLRQFSGDNSELLEDTFRRLDEWRDEFVAEHGREPELDDLEELAREEMGEDFDNDEAVGKNSEFRPLLQLVKSCSWCGKQIKEEHPLFALGIQLKMNVFRENDGPRVISYCLASLQKEIHALLVPDGSEAKHEGNDLMVVTCSGECAYQLRDALEEESRIARITLMN